MDKDYYYSIKNVVEGGYREKGSKFLSFAFPVKDMDDIDAAMEEVKSIHPTARHYCYAYRLGIDGEPHRMNDDGEPSGTAGRPIHGQLLSYNLSDIMVIVVRYFGGTLLGASGLIKAYKASTEDALAKATKIKKVIVQHYKLSFTYAEMGKIMDDVKSLDIPINDKSFEATPEICVSLRKSREEQLIIALKARLLGITEDEVTVETKIPFCTFTKVASC